MFLRKSLKKRNGNETQHEMLRRLELTEEMHKELIAHCTSRNIGFFSTSFDIEDESSFFAGRTSIIIENVLSCFKFPSFCFALPRGRSKLK